MAYTALSRISPRQGRFLSKTFSTNFFVQASTFRDYLASKQMKQVNRERAGQAKPYVQPGNKAASGTGGSVRKKKSGRTQQKVWVTGQKAATRLAEGV